LIMALLLAVSGQRPAMADEGKIKISGLLDELKLGGDLRIREETRYVSGSIAGAGNKNRQRFRLRLSADATEGPVVVHIRLASGQGEQVSTNQSERNLAAEKPFWIDKAYVELKQIPMVVLEGGKMSNLFFMGATNQIVWDDDFNPEGFGQRFSMNLDDSGSVFVNLGQLILNGDTSGSKAQWLIVGQAGTELKTEPGVFKVDILFYEEEKGREAPFQPGVTQDGNTRKADGSLRNSFRVINVNASAKLKVVIPVAISVDYAHNLADTTQADGSTNANTAYGFGVQLGKAKGPNTVEAGFEYRSIEADAVLCDINDSDFGPNGGTNRKGFKAWGAYGLTDSTQLKLTVFDTTLKDENLPPVPAASDKTNPSQFRVQGDLVVSF
jgi:hypothetical protein